MEVTDLTLSFTVARHGVACVTFTRSDGHKLSLSSMDRDLCLFDAKGNTVKEYGSFQSAESFLKAIQEFAEGGDNW